MGFDSDNDEKVSKEELPEPMQRMFERADANNDGAIDRTEAEAFVERVRGGGGGAFRGGRREEAGGRPDAPRRPERPE